MTGRQFTLLLHHPFPNLPRSCKPGHPVQLLQLPFSKSEELHFVLVNPVFEAPTAEMRAVLPKEVPMKSMINNCCQGGSLVRLRVGGKGGLSGTGKAMYHFGSPVRCLSIPQ